MNATTIQPGAAIPARRTARADRRPSLARLTAVELRKMLDTRAGFWLPVAVAVATVIIALVSVSQHHGDQATLASVFTNTTQPAAYLLPIIGVLLICGEFSQRTTLISFTLVPRRGRVLLAKLIACVLVATVAFAISVACTYVFTLALGHAAGGAGKLGWQMLGQGWLFLTLQMLMGFAFGSLILISAAAIVTFLLLPTVWNLIVTSANSLDAAARWINPDQTLLPLVKQLQTTTWPHVAATVGVWILAPLALGWARIAHHNF
jgi:ABC-2 type transport system permease protein